MPSTNKTPNIGLNNWLGTDRPKRDDFNADNMKIDEKVGELIDKVGDVGQYERKTYAELKAMKTDKTLKEGKRYLLTDYRTKYKQPTTNVIKTMSVEELILTASSANTFEPIVVSVKYPYDTIWYDFNNALCEDGITERNGFILRRYDVISGNDAPQDWRTMLWARYKPHATSYMVGELKLNYLEWRTGANIVMGRVYKADNKLWMATNTNTPTDGTDVSVFHEIYPDLDTPLLIKEKTTWSDGIELLRGDLIEVPTFEAGCEHNTIKARINKQLHNNVFGKTCTRNTLGTDCHSNTFGESCIENVLDAGCFSNILSKCLYNNIAIYCYNNILLKDCHSNSFGSGCYSNILLNYCFGNSFGNNCSSNIFNYGDNHNSFGNNCSGNKCLLSFQSNSFGNNCSNNSFAWGCRYNSFGNEFGGNTFSEECYRNSFGNGCENNTFGKACIYNSFGNNCDKNTFGTYCQSNLSSNYFSGNKFGNNCSNNSFSPSITNSAFGEQFRYNIVKGMQGKDISTIGGFLTSASVTVTMERNTQNYFVYWYIHSSGTISVVEIP